MEINISHKTRQEILGTLDLALPNLFNHAVNEMMQLMKMVRLFINKLFGITNCCHFQ